MGPNLFLNSLRELYLSFCSELLDNSCSLTYICLLWLLLLFLYFLLGISSTPTCCENEHTQKRRGRAKRRRKGGTLKGSRYYHREEEKTRRPNSSLERLLGQYHDTTCFCQRLCPDPSCELCNDITTELSQLSFSETLEDSPPSVFSLASTAPVTETSFTQSPAFSVDPPGDLIPPPLPEPFPPILSILPTNPRSALSNFLLPSPLGQTPPPGPILPLESKFPVHHSPHELQNSFSSNLDQCDDFHQELPILHSTKTSFGGDAASKLTDPSHLLFLSPDGHDLAQQYSYLKNREDPSKTKLIQLFWGLPSLHSESLSSAVYILGDYSSNFIFNSTSNASIGQESPVLPYFLPPSLLEVKPQPLPQTLPQSQTLPPTQTQPQTLPPTQTQPQTLSPTQTQPQTLPPTQTQPQTLPPTQIQPQTLPPTQTQPQTLPPTQTQPQTHLEPPLLILPSSPTPQTSVCGVQFHGPQDELECLTSSEIQCLEWNVLQKKQESVWGLPSVVQKSREDFCPSAPAFPYHRPCKAPVAISISTLEFPLSSELREEFEHHLRKRLIQHRWGLPRRIQESLSLMRPPTKCSGKCESKSSYGLSWISAYKDQSNQPGNSYERVSEMFWLEEDKGTDEGHSQESDLKDSLSDSESSSHKDVEHDSEKDLALMSLSEENSVVSGQSESLRQLEKDLKEHLSEKLEDISEGQLPGSVHGSWHTIEEAPSVKSDNEIKQRSLPPSVGGDSRLNTSQELSFLEPGTQQVLEAHITRLRMKKLWRLPAKILESIKIFKLKDTSPRSVLLPRRSSSTNLISEVNSKPGGFTPQRGSSKSLHREKVGTENSATVPNTPLSDTSLVGKEGQRTLSQSPSDIKRRIVGEVRRIGDARQALLPVTNSVTSKASETHFPITNIQPPELPARQAGAGHEPEGKNVNSNDKAEMQLGRNMEEKVKPASMPSVSREIVKAEELTAVQYKGSDILTTDKPGLSQRMNENETKGTTMTTKKPPPKIPGPKSSDFNKQLIEELNSKLEKRNDRQAQGQPTDMSHETNKASLPRAQGVPSVDVGASQVLHVHLEDRTTFMEQGKEPWVPKQVLNLCPNKNFPPAAKKVGPTGSKLEELGGGDAGLVTSQPGRKRVPARGALKEMVGSKSPQTLSQKRESPPDSIFINKMKSFFEWFQPGIKYKRQENPQVKGSPISSAQSRVPGRSRAAFTGKMEAQKVMSDIGRFPDQRLGRRHTGDTTGAQEPLSLVVGKFGTAQQKVAATRPWAEPVQRYPPNPRAPSCKRCCQAAAFGGQSPTSSRYAINESRHPQKVGALKVQQLYQKHPQLVPHRGTVTHRPSPLCRPQTVRGPPAALTAAEGTMFGDPCLPFKQKMLL